MLFLISLSVSLFAFFKKDADFGMSNIHLFSQLSNPDTSLNEGINNAGWAYKRHN